MDAIALQIGAAAVRAKGDISKFLYSTFHEESGYVVGRYRRSRLTTAFVLQEGQ